MYQTNISEENHVPLTAEVVQEYLQRKDYKSLLVLCKSHNQFLKEFTKMKWLNQTHNVGDVVLIDRSTVSNKKMLQVVKLIAIYCVLGFSGELQFPLVEVQVYCGRDELHQKVLDKYVDCFSEYEMFQTSETDVLFVEAVQKKCQVVSQEKYEQMIPQPYLYFNRAEYNKQSQKFEPPVDQWKKACVCNKPLNPDKAYIFCDSCSQWFHMECMRITQLEADSQEQYTCKKCLKKSQDQ